MSVLIEQAQQRGELKGSVDPKLLAYNMFALHFSFLVVWLGSGLRSPDPAKPSMREMLEMQLVGLVESPGKKLQGNTRRAPGILRAAATQARMTKNARSLEVVK
jgi:hypothetical protein